ncbi:hypothetical protein H6P81_007423 [Aristolochia fimbriata]|uniref:Bet v I/Major latex protein domain-containing protein n=1 Tax=Aristolochia fimbriata TaxID=158543 RepID=A0AAV7F1A1_ARIFI|nr:hypothetical protein H6P81_007423 [Aristolochia fimbriata]
MHGRVWTEFEVQQPASKVWEIYGTLKLATLILQKLPQYAEKIEFDGDGGVGTVLTVTFSNGTRGFGTLKESFVVIDDEKRVKVAEVSEGGFLDQGITSYRTTLEIAEKEGGSSIIRSSIDFEVDDENASKTPAITTAGLTLIAKMVAEHLAERDGEKKGPVDA